MRGRRQILLATLLTITIVGLAMSMNNARAAVERGKPPMKCLQPTPALVHGASADR